MLRWISGIPPRAARRRWLSCALIGSRSPAAPKCSMLYTPRSEASPRQGRTSVSRDLRTNLSASRPPEDRLTRSGHAVWTGCFRRYERSVRGTSGRCGCGTLGAWLREMRFPTRSIRSFGSNAAITQAVGTTYSVPLGTPSRVACQRGARHGASGFAFPRASGLLIFC